MEGEKETRQAIDTTTAGTGGESERENNNDDIQFLSPSSSPTSPNPPQSASSPLESQVRGNYQLDTQ